MDLDEEHLIASLAEEAAFEKEAILNRRLDELARIGNERPEYRFCDVEPIMYAWSTPFKKTKAYDDFKLKLVDCATSTTAKFYARVISVIQSSGSGKSRLVDEVAKSCFTLPLCLRPWNANGYPFGDNIVVSQLCTSETNSRTVTAFFCHLLRRTLAELTAKPALRNADAWHTRLGGPQSANDFLSERPRKQFHRAVVRNVLKDDRSEKDILEDLEQVLSKLADVVEGGFVTIYMDEAQELLSNPTRWHGPKHELMLYHPVTELMHRLRGRPGLALVLISTMPSTSLQTPSKEAWPALYPPLPEGEKGVPQPWTCLPGAVYPIRPPGDAPWTPQYTRTFRPCANLGRPIWGSAIQEDRGSRVDPYVYEEDGWDARATKDLAFLKLNNRRGRHGIPRADEALQAALTCRLGLKIAPTVEGSQLAEALVSQRMATALYIDPVQNTVTATYSIDPVLGWASFQVMQTREPLRDVVMCLCRMTQSHEVENELGGQFVTRLALTRAYDLVLTKPLERPLGRQDYKWVSQITNFAAVSLGDFFTALSGTASILDTLDVAGVKPLSVLKDCSLVLAQWVHVHGSQAEVGKELAIEALVAHCGLQMPSDIPDLDQMLALCKDPTEPISKSNLVVIFLQSLNRNFSKTADVPRQTIEHFSTMGVPVIYILHEVLPVETTFSMDKDVNQTIHNFPHSQTLREQADAARSTQRKSEESSKMDIEQELNHQSEDSPPAEVGDIWCLTMKSVHSKLLDQRMLRDIVVKQCDPFLGRGAMDQKAIFDMLPLLTMEEHLRGTVYEEAARNGLFE